MIEAPTPLDEPARLAALRELGLLDGKPERAFDDIVELVRKMLDVPIVLVSLVDAERQWFQARTGFDAQETPRSVSFCGHAIMQPGILLVPDATLDPRFHDNPLVTGEPFLRFYAGVPLRLPDGFQIGTLCALSTTPRDDFGAEAQAALVLFARLTLDAIELHAMRRRTERAQANVAHQADLWDRVDVPLAFAENDGRLTLCNAAFRRLCGGNPIGRPADEALGIVWSPLDMAEAATQSIDNASMHLTVERGADGFLFVGKASGIGG